MPSRSILDLKPELQEKAKAFEEAMKEAGIRFRYTCTYRSQKEQDDLYAQGRTKPGPIVTKVRHSKHTDREAFDVVVLDAVGRPVWAPSAYMDLGKLGQKVGLRWGGDWDGDGQTTDERFVDLPHFELA